MIRQYELVERVKAYDPSADEDLLNKAYIYAMKVHGAQKRASGDPYFSHPLEVAGILTELKLDAETIATALLHDTVEDTEATHEDIQKLFGETVAALVDGVTKLTQLETQSLQNKQAENFRKLILAMSKDIRVLLVKLADRLHNMRTLHYISKKEKRQRIARETLEIYIPLAERIGIHKIKDELEDLAFSQLNAEARSTILERLAYLKGGEDTLIKRIENQLRNLFNEHNLSGIKVHGREKAPYSIWKKMQHKNITFEQLLDVMAFRIIVKDTTQCYQILGILHSAYHVVPDRFKDYISNPKPNGYRSIHSGLVGPEGQKIEVQIRTDEMHDVAEYGVAAHWAYKEGKPKTEGSEYRWLRELLDIVEQAQKPDEFLEHTKLELFQDEVFCFSPQGDIIALPMGATPVDFAYAVHSEVGDHCVGAKVNGRMVPLRTKLNNGDQIEVITSKTQTPSPTWERFVVTGKARARIRRYVKSQQREQYEKLGKGLLQKSFKNHHKNYQEKKLQPFFEQLSAHKIEDLYANIGMGNQSAIEVFHLLHPEQKNLPSLDGETNDQIALAKDKNKLSKLSKYALPIKGLIPGMAMHFAGCCHPLQGDSIIGIIQSGSGITIHTRDCENLKQYQDTPERWIDVEWNVDKAGESEQTGRLLLVMVNRSGALGKVSTVVANQNANISNLKIINRSQEYYEMILDVHVRNLQHLKTVIAALRTSPYILSVDRKNKI